MSKIIAHKGGDYLFPENSYEAIIDSYHRNTCDGTELDIRMTKDHVLVVVHDVDAFRSGNQFKLIRNHTYQELKNLEVRPHRIDWYLQYLENRFSNDGIHDSYNLELLRILKKKRGTFLTLKEALEQLPQDHELIVEYKGCNEEYDARKTYQKVILETVLPYQKKQIKIKGYDREIGLFLKEKLDHQIEVGTLVNKKTIQNIDAPFDFVSISFSLLKKQPELLEQCIQYHHQNRELYVWTLDRYQQFLECVKQSQKWNLMPHVITNNPDVMSCLMNAYLSDPDHFEENTEKKSMKQLLK